MTTALPAFLVGDHVTIATDDPMPILGGAPVVWTITDIDVWPGTDIRYAELRPAYRSKYTPRTMSLSRLVPVEDAA